MSMNVKRFTNYDREIEAKNGRKIHIYRQRTVLLSKAEVVATRENKEEMKLVSI